jgi:DegV family protein with EDD domain
MTVRIVTDSTADLPQELVRELDITVVPTYVNMHGHSYRDGVDISHDDIYKNMEQNGLAITTAQPSPNDFVKAYQNVLRETDDIVSIHCSAKLSGIYQSALIGCDLAGAKGRIEVVDSQMTSMGLGLVAIAAARLAKTGVSLTNVLDETHRAVSQSHIWALFDTLKYAFRSGRIGKVTTLLGGIINIKPILTIKDGSIHPNGITRTRTKGIEKLIDNVRKFKTVHDIGIVHSTTLDEAQKLRAKLSAIVDKNRIYISRLGPCLGVYGGPGVLVLSTLATDIPKITAEAEIEKARKNRLHMPSFNEPELNCVCL